MKRVRGWPVQPRVHGAEHLRRATGQGSQGLLRESVFKILHSDADRKHWRVFGIPFAPTMGSLPSETMHPAIIHSALEYGLTLVFLAYLTHRNPSPC
jgi:hypothetical protein